ncbi:hypothetical protein TIFTF001_031443 [Ficus carica]|uniref:Uncharacterized protein n=1 Tax=Ficus carica TaxID=3494 RepID=A0AA88DV08_FICCA|nr:hypothetical protein TIFTF001_031443 [Ficus carica]
MGNIQGSRSSIHVPDHVLIHSQNYNHPTQGQYIYPQPNREHPEAPPQKNNPSNIIDCNEAAKRYGWGCHFRTRRLSKEVSRLN